MLSPWALGVLSALAVALYYAVYVRLVKGIKWAPRLPQRLQPPALPKEVIDELEALDDQDSNDGENAPLLNAKREPMNWCNLLIQWLHSQSHPFDKTDGRRNEHIDMFARWFEGECRELPWDVCRLPVGCGLREGRLRDHFFGSHFPVFSSVKFLKSTLRPGLFCVSGDCQYDGGVGFHLQWDTVWHRNDHSPHTVDLLASFVHMRGRFWVVFDGDRHFYMGFRRKDFHIRLWSRLVIDGHWESSVLNALLSRVLMPLAFASKFVLPWALKGKFLRNGPEQPPYPWECPPDQPDLYYTWQPPSSTEVEQ